MTIATNRRATRLLAIAGITAAVLLGACSSSSSTDAIASASSTAKSDTTSSASRSSSSSDSSSASSGADPCLLITADDAAAAIGGPVGPAQPRTSKGGGHSCTYTETPTAVDSGLVTVTVFSPDVTFQSLKDQYTDQQPLPGVGDEGFLAFMDGTAGGNAGFRSGSTVVVISLGAKGDTAAIPGKLQVLAAAAAGRL